MVPVLAAKYTLVLVTLLLVVVLVSAKLLQPDYWRSRGTTFVAFGGMFGGLALWAFGAVVHSVAAVYAGAGLAYTGVLVLTPAVVVLPFSALADRGLMWLVPAPKPAPPVEEEAPAAKLSRRALIRFGGASLPSFAAAAGASGLVSARLAPKLPIIRMRFPDLPPDLDGLRILQLSDLHLGAEMRLQDLEEHLGNAMRERQPDLVVVTGDLSDDNALIAPALEIIHRLRPRLGAFASLGNHEYLHDIAIARPLFEASPVPLLVSEGRTIPVGNARLYIAGADDPVHMSGDIAWMLGPSIEAAAKNIEGADFRLLLCHRPEGFGPGADAGFDLTLSGHTHGGQLGFLGRSLLEKVRPEVSWWGPYARPRKVAGRTVGTSRLYTTSGMGHWFPFRLGCPTEMPLVVLERG